MNIPVPENATGLTRQPVGGSGIAKLSNKEALELLTKAKSYLERVFRLDEVKETRDRFKAMLAYLKQKKDASEASLHYAEEICTRAELRIGELLNEILLREGKDAALAIALANGISHTQASRWLRAQQELGDLVEGAIKTVANSQSPTGKPLARNVDNVVQAVSKTAYNDWRIEEYDGDEWYTVGYAEDARKTMGGIDLDPCSCALAQKDIKATTFYTKEQDGLNFPWSGRVWMAPPFSRGLIGRFVSKLVIEFNNGNIEQAVVLVNSATDTSWYQLLAQNALVVCLPNRRLSFSKGGKIICEPPGGQTFFYFGTKEQPFIANFGRYGVMLARTKNCAALEA